MTDFSPYSLNDNDWIRQSKLDHMQKTGLRWYTSVWPRRYSINLIFASSYEFLSLYKNLLCGEKKNLAILMGQIFGMVDNEYWDKNYKSYNTFPTGCATYELHETKIRHFSETRKK